MAEIKKILRNIYKFDLSRCDLSDGYEIINSNGVYEFTSNFRKRDIDNGIIVTPGNYLRGLIYKTTNGGEFYNKPNWMPDVISFSYNIYGLKKGAFYKITVISRNVSKYNNLTDTTDNRTLSVITDSEEVLLYEDVSNYYENKEFSTIFKANSMEMNIFFKIGKIYINNIIIDEIELIDDDIVIDEPEDIVLAEGKTQLAAYGIFNPNVTETNRYSQVDRLSGTGIKLFYDKVEKVYVLERDNDVDVLQTSFNNIEYFIDINTNKLPQSDDFDRVVVKEIDPGVSPNTLKQGYLKIAILNKDGQNVKYTKDGRLIIFVHKIY